VAITLPGHPAPSDAAPRLLDFGSDIVPPFGGALLRLSRLGSRFALDVQMPPMKAEPDGRIWVSRLIRGKSQRVVMEFPQPDLNVGAPGVPLVRSVVAGGSSLPLKGLTPYYPIREGQFMSVIHNGRRYMQKADAETIADASGNADVPITPILRTDLAINDVVEIAVPMIEGAIDGDELGWSLNAARHTGLAFSIVEAE
jgi:hypothetical protein